MSSTSDNESTDSAMEAPVTQKNFNFKLKTYPAEFKLHAVNDAKLTNNSVSARKYGVDVHCIIRWVGQQVQVQVQGELKKFLYAPPPLKGLYKVLSL